jgi:hypothetical protein
VGYRLRRVVRAEPVTGGAGEGVRLLGGPYGAEQRITALAWGLAGDNTAGEGYQSEAGRQGRRGTEPSRSCWTR